MLLEKYERSIREKTEMLLWFMVPRSAEVGKDLKIPYWLNDRGNPCSSWDCPQFMPMAPAKFLTKPIFILKSILM